MDKRQKLTGVFAPVTTPFVKDEIAFERLAENIAKLNASPLQGYFALGSNGESKALNFEESKEVLKTIVSAAQNKVVMAGAGAESTKETIRRTEQVAELGAHFASVLTPHYFKKQMTDAVLIRYYQEVADASPIPVLLYNAPGFTAITISPKVVAEIAAHPNIAGMKDTSSGNKDTYLDSARGKEFVILAGSANDFFPSLILGAIGGVLSLANAFPEICCELYQLTHQARIEPARSLHQKIVQANQAVSGSFGVAGVKAAMDLAGYFGGEPRRPLLSLTAEQTETLKKNLQTIGVLS